MSNTEPEEIKDFKRIDKLPCTAGSIVTMKEYNGMLYVACSFAVYVLTEEGLEPVEFVVPADA